VRVPYPPPRSSSAQLCNRVHNCVAACTNAGQTMEGLLSADGSFSPDSVVKQIKQYATLRYWVSGPEAPVYQQYVKTGITFYLLFYLMQVSHSHRAAGMSIYVGARVCEMFRTDVQF
jgi:hypothetical protein